MNKSILILVAVLVLGGLGYYWYTTKDLFTCDDYTSFMTTSVDEFEEEIDFVPLTESGTDKISGGKYDGKELKYRQYAAGNVMTNYFSFTIFPENDVFLFETNLPEVHQETKNLFKDCDFKFSETLQDEYDVYKRDDLSLGISKREVETILGDKTIYSFWLEK